MTTWRDIADQLSPTQVGHLEWLEQDPLNGLLAKPAQHLVLARGWASENLEQSLHADVAPPADAVDVGPWLKSSAGVRTRSYRSVMTGLAGLDITLELRGSQHTDGRIQCRLGLAGSDLNNLSPAAARELAAALAAAADRAGGR